MANGKYSATLKQPGFLAFFWTQFLGAFNDNFLKIVVSFIALDLATRGASSYVELIAFLFILPSALFSGYAGHLADVYSKRTILVAVKFFEMIIMILALAAFFTGHFESMLAGRLSHGHFTPRFLVRRSTAFCRRCFRTRIYRAAMGFWR